VDDAELISDGFIVKSVGFVATQKMAYKLEPSLWLKQMKGRQVEDNIIMLALTLN